jgi:PAS domain S-box-containing protein
MARVLVVDDDEACLRVVGEVLLSEGHEVNLAANGAEALAQAARSTPDLIISDILMPVMDGFTLCQKCKRDRRLRSVPFIFHTGTYTDNEDRERALSLGADRFLVKPSSPDRLLDEVGSVLSGERYPRARRHSGVPEPDPGPPLREYNEALVRELELRLSGLERTHRDLSGVRSTLETRVKQQSVVAQLGQLALMDIELDSLLGECVRAVAEALDIEFVTVLELLPGRRELLLRAGVGWRDGVVGQATMGVACGSEAGHTLLSCEPVVVEDLRSETRFSKPAILLEHGVVSGISVLIGDAAAPWGALAGHTQEFRRFSVDDTHFLQAVSNVLDSAILRKSAEADLRKLNRELRAVGECNQALVRAESQTELLDNICRIICNVGGYVMAWVGVAEHDAEKRVRPVASYGAEEGYLSKVRIVWADTEEGRGPTGTAIREGRTVVNPSFPADPSVALWREEATRRGYRSSVALPLKAPGLSRPLGAISIYSAHLDAFTPYEVSLLEGLANDLGYGLAALRVSKERDEVVQALRDSEARYKTLVDSIPLMVFMKDMNSTYVSCNQAFANERGITPEQVIGKTDEDFFGPDLAEKRRADDRRVLLTGESKLIEDIYRQNGDSRVLQTVKRPVRDQQGAPIGILGISWDITELRRVEEENRRLEATLRQQQKLDSIGTLAAGVAHEINNPIMSVLNCAQLILDQAQSDSETARDARAIVQETERIAAIVRNLLQFARHDKQERSPARIGDIVESTLSLTRAVLRHDQVKLEIEIPDGLPPTRCRSQQIQQVLMNLLTNARDALNEKYPGRHDDKILRVRCTQVIKGGRDWIRVTVEDHGVGIREDIADRVFDPFFTTKPKEKGTGLGLSVSHGIAKEHGGDLFFESQTGVHTLFHLDLPVDREASAAGGDEVLPGAAT